MSRYCDLSDQLLHVRKLFENKLIFTAKILTSPNSLSNILIYKVVYNKSFSLRVSGVSAYGSGDCKR